MISKQLLFHLISVALVPAAAFAVNLGALWTSSNNVQYSNYLLFIQWSSFIGSILGLNLIELKTSIKTREANIDSFLTFLYFFNVLIILVFLFFFDGAYFSVSSIAITSASVALYNSLNSVLVFRGEIVGLFVQRICRFAFLVAVFPLLAILGSEFREEAIYYAYTLSFLLPALLNLKGPNISKCADSIVYTMNFLLSHRRLVCIRSMSYAIDMAHFPVIVLAIDNVSKIRNDVSWFYFLAFFGVALPLVTVIKQFVGERFRILLMSKEFIFSEVALVKFSVAVGFILICSGCVGYFFVSSVTVEEWNNLSAFIIGWIFLGVFVLSLASGITSVLMQHLSLHGLDLILNLVTLILTAFAFLFGSFVGLTLLDVLLVLSVSLGIKYLGHSCAVIYFKTEKIFES